MGMSNMMIPWGDMMNNNNDTWRDGTRSRRRVMDQAGYDKIIYDILSSDQGLAALAGAENMSGGYGSSTKGLMAQDLVAKLAGELAILTSEEVESTHSQDTKRSALGGQLSVICTVLNKKGILSDALYSLGVKHFQKLSPITVYGYQWWAVPIAKNFKLCKLLAPMVIKRYEYLVQDKFSVSGWLSVKLGEPICYLLGLIRLALEEKEHVAFS